MKENKVVEAIGKVDDKYINEAINYKRKKKNVYTGLMGFAALVASLFLVLGVGMYNNGNKVDSVVSIDINPSIELTISKHNKVLSAIALNEDAEIVLGSMDFKNVDLDTALNAIMGSLLKNGYLDEVYNAVNVCVESEDTERASQVGEKVTSEISSIFDENDLIGGINTQLCTSSEEMKKLAESYGISVGKLELAQKVSANMGISLDIVVDFSISELWDLLDAESADIIMKDEALKIAMEDAQVEESEIVLESNKIQENSGLFTYVIKFTVGDCEIYKYEIDAIEGTILEREYEYVSKDEIVDEEVADEEITDEETSDEESTDEVVEDGTEDVEEEATNSPKPEKHITKIEALTIAYSDAGVGESDAKLEELKHKPIEKEYHIEFTVGLCEYVYVINAVDGSIISKEAYDNTSTDDNTEEIAPESIISVDEALKLALDAAGVVLEDLTKCDIKYTNKVVSAEYKIHFHVDKEHYDYTVNAVTGEVVEKTHPTPVAPVLPHEKEEAPKPEAPTSEPPVLPHEKEEVPTPVPPTPAEPLKPHEKEEKPTPAEPLKPHEKEEVAKPEAPTPIEPLKPHEKEEAAKPEAPTPEAPTPIKPLKPHEKEEAAKPEAPTPPVGPEDTKVTISFEEETN